MQYGQPQGDPQLRIEVAALLKERGITAMPDDIIITAGVTQGLSMVTQALTQPGDTVLMEMPTYLGLINIVTAYGLRPIGVPRDEEGPRPDILEQTIIQQQPRFFYLIPTFHNPTGRTMSPARRREILALAERYGLLLVEDDIYCRLNYDDPCPPALKAEDDAGRVIYLSSFSKDLLPGTRIGYMTAPKPLQQRLPTLRGSMDLFGPPLMERAVAEFLRRKKFKTHLRRTVPIYRARRDGLLQSLAETMPAEVSWTTPQGGFACWVTLPADERLNDLYHAALQRGVAFSPGAVFMAQPSRQRHLRLCFGNQPVEVIRESVAILADLIRERITGRRYPVGHFFEQAPMV